MLLLLQNLVLSVFQILAILIDVLGFPSVSVVKTLPANAGDTALIPESGRCPGVRNGNPL